MNYEEHPSDESPGGRLGAMSRWLRFPSLSRLLRWALLLTAAGWTYLNWHADKPLEELTARYAYPQSRFIHVDGMEVHYRVCGQGEPIVLLHDANSSLHTWATWTDSLSRQYQVISLDLPGFGLTGPHPQASYSTFMYTGFFDKFVQALHLNRFHLAGNGLGAQIAWFYATEHPERLNKLILLNAPGFEKRSGDWIEWIARTPVVNRVMWKITPRKFIHLMLEDVYADDRNVSEELIDRHFDLLLRPGNRKAFTDRASVSENRPPVDLVEKINTPTLILWGAEDTRISPEFAYDFHRKIHKSLLRIYQNTGHWPQEENPGMTAKDVQRFLEGRF